MPSLGRILRALCGLLLLAPFSVSLANASATLLLEEPYGRLGFFTATGHAAVYLSGVCAETPVVLRPCAPGELGAVISRYDGVAGCDWVAVPLIPYLYAVEQPDDIPLFVDPKLVTFLRDQYRRRHLEALAPNLSNGKTPGGNWYELVGSAYDRAAYAFQIETTPEQDQAFIREYNSAPNRSRFHLSYRNCADFAKDVINFYYPKSLHRSVVADIGITTPKQMAKTLIKFSAHHPELQFSRYVIPQVPGTQARSTAAHGVVESFFKAKKYIVPSVVASPIFAGCVAAVYVGTGAGHFDPARQAMVFNADRPLEKPIQAEDRRSFQIELNHLAGASHPDKNSARLEKEWGRVMGKAAPDFDSEGYPIVRIPVGEHTVSVGIAGGNILAKNSSGEFAQQLLAARLHAELRRGNPKASENDVEHDWSLLQKTLNSDSQVATENARPVQTGAARWERPGNRQ